MADIQSNQQEERGFESLKRHIAANRIDFCLGATRLASILFTFAYFIPIIGNPYSAYYRVLLANAATSALRLHQRLPPPEFTKEFVIKLFSEDSCHYLLFSMIFLYVSPIALILLPVFMFSLIHFSSYALRLLDILGQNSWWGMRIFISLVEFQSTNILRLIAFTEILLMPLVVVILFMGKAGLLTPIVYYHFLTLRYASRRNPYTRHMFRELRLKTESFASRPSTPEFIRNIVNSTVNIMCRLAPQPAAESPAQ